MKTSALFYSYEPVFDRIKRIVTQKGYIIAAESDIEGIIKAYHKSIFKKTMNLDVQISKIDADSTYVKLMVNGHNETEDSSFNSDGVEEEKLIHSIVRRF